MTEAKNTRDAYDDYVKKFPYNTIDSLLDHANNILQESKKYYVKLFKKEDGDCYKIHQMAAAAQIFNPLYIKDMSNADIVVTLHELADKLVHFQYSHFTENFISRLKKEIPGVVNEANFDSDLDKFENSEGFSS